MDIKGIEVRKIVPVDERHMVGDPRFFPPLTQVRLLLGDDISTDWVTAKIASVSPEEYEAARKQTT